MTNADLSTLQRVVEDTFQALGVTDNEAALVEIERLQALALRAQQADAGVREKEIIERCAQVAETVLRDQYLKTHGQARGLSEAEYEIAAAIRALNVAPPAPVVEQTVETWQREAMLHGLCNASPALNDPVVDPRNSEEGER